jgi:hypothetical protein
VHEVLQLRAVGRGVELAVEARRLRVVRAERRGSVGVEDLRPDRLVVLVAVRGLGDDVLAARLVRGGADLGQRSGGDLLLLQQRL